MFKTIYILLILFGINTVTGQNNIQKEYVIVNEDSISLTDFHNIYQHNIEVEGMDEAIDNYINFKLMSQHSKRNKVDTTFYYKNLLNEFTTRETKTFLEPIALLDSLSECVYKKLEDSYLVEIYSLPYSTLFNKKGKKDINEKLNHIKNTVCNQPDSVSVAKIKQDLKVKEFWTKPLALSSSIDDIIAKTEKGSCSKNEENDFNTYFIKVLDYKKVEDIPTYETIKVSLNSNIPKSAYADLIKENLLNKIRHKVNIEENKIALQETILYLESKFKDSTVLDSLFDNHLIWKTAYSEMSQRDLIKRIHAIENIFKLNRESDYESFIAYVIPKLKDEFLLTTYKINLPKIEAELGNKIDQMKESLLVNYFIESEVYKKAKLDSVGQRQYLLQHQDTYTWPERADVSIYRYYDKKIEPELIQMISSKKPEEEILKEFNTKGNPLKVVLTKGKFSHNNPILPKGLDANKNMIKAKYQTKDAIYVLNESLKPSLMTIEEASKSFIPQFQSYLYDQALQNLKAKAVIIIPNRLK